MNKLKIAFIICLGIIFFSACEKDDICVDGNTPLLVVRFYNIAATSQTKAPNKLRVVGTGLTTPVPTFADRSSIDSITLPLRAGELNTSYSFILHSEDDSDGLETGIINTLSFNHITKEVFVSRACGFVANYDNLETNLTADGDIWIKDIEIISATVQNSDSAHVKIFH